MRINRFALLGVLCFTLNVVLNAQTVVVKQTGKTVSKLVSRAIGSKTVQLAEKDLGKALIKSLSVLPKESNDFLRNEMSKNPSLLSFFKENPTFVSSWEHLHKNVPIECVNPNFLKMFVFANRYSSYGGNKLENFLYQRAANRSVKVFSKDGKHLLATIKPGNIIEVVGDNVNNWFLQLKPFPNVRYIINGAEYITDNTGRVIRSKTVLTPKNLGMSKYRDVSVQSQMAHCKGSRKGDDAGHIIANQFGGSTNMVNLVPMEGRSVNRGSYKRIENTWRRLIEEGKNVKIDIKFSYPAKPKDCERPDWIEVIYNVDGKNNRVLIKNVA